MLVALLEVLEQQPYDMSSMEMVSSGGATVAPELARNIKKVFDCTFGTLYGQTETSPVITQHHHDDSFEDIQPDLIIGHQDSLYQMIWRRRLFFVGHKAGRVASWLRCEPPRLTRTFHLDECLNIDNRLYRRIGVRPKLRVQRKHRQRSA